MLHFTGVNNNNTALPAIKATNTSGNTQIYESANKGGSKRKSKKRGGKKNKRKRTMRRRACF